MPPFRTLELSDPAFETDHLRRVTVKTPNLGGRGDLTVFVPPGTAPEEKLPVVTLLHGVYGSHWCWSAKAGVHRTAAAMIASGELPPLLIAMPGDGGRFDGTGYRRHRDADYGAWIVEDVPAALIQAGLPAGAEAPRFLAGLSMGGYGALRLGAMHPDRFAGFAGHSSITRFEELGGFVEEDLDAYDLVDGDPHAIDALLRNRDRLPPFRFDCGVDDPLIDGNRRLHRELDAAGIAHGYAEHPGGHEWPYWQRHVSDTLRFFGGILRGA
ncbi:alpha/beta hydrolase [Phycisphaera mikurensis]|uniref:Putative esterase n=1 Tax=Phycisphaera mikurensis (strain NBRC 102666 / KCTC 22515 / FYK2301M01) TaxID=1142394 RepID=I0IG61_PHYMF|nr:alpha/beta hydrolase-fold protein [Phycisphaera mikurensis]MBB6440368.1 S-formylglutathione hydrolase FrmB [Phycisphaera mikurensis]BAM04249.1 putative esterase [Phycisphaera mikurensis NBRC 102666]